MSNHLAIAATTATLRGLLDKKLDEIFPVRVTARSPDKARDTATDDQVNLFLYQTMPSAAWRNRDMPSQLKPGETGHPPLPLTLYYLLTAYSDEAKDDFKSQILLGRAMSVLHDHPLLDKTEIKNVSSGDLATSDLHEQIERVRITLEPMPLEELSKLWTAFQTHYRTSAAYKVDVVLIESTRPAKAPLPVLERGKGDKGVTSQPDVESPFPTLLGIGLPNGQLSARLGDALKLTGRHLTGTTVSVQLVNPRLDEPLTNPAAVTITNATDTEVDITLKNDPVLWAAGLFTVSVVVTTGADVRTTNELPLTVAPRITTALPLNVVRNPVTHEATIPLSVSPEVRPGQRASLVIGSREVPANVHPAQTANLTFLVKEAPLGKHFLRVRIDGVDSLLVIPGPPPVFDPNQTVTIT
ncbi:MAG TPA: DUF4255 domain-containing protein [Thermoanaerobaculia bacterium]|nr:DUF4255 domain-containing protein [Thermoanaerobaculia bacterium]